jgi:formylglycine-generating enzyme required for sulfatase activity
MKKFFSIFIHILLALYAPAQVSHKAGTAFRDCSDCPEMIIVPAGTFIMGAPVNEAGAYGEEQPQRTVSVKQFAIGKFDITRGQWAEFVSATQRATSGGCAYSLLPKEKEAGASWRNPGFEQDDNHPVVCISWFDARDYVSWLSKKTLQPYRLLSEAEWEYAARAGSTTAYPWGATATHDNANYGADSGFTGYAYGRDKWMCTSPVGSFPPNAFGLYDMHGNVLQFVDDCFSNSYLGLPVDGSSYKVEVVLKMKGELASMNATTSCAYRMLRGGNWGDPPPQIRSAFRNWAPPPGSTLENYRTAGAGFRIAKSL